MNQEEFISWIKNNSQWIISKFENLEDYKESNDDLKAGDIIINSINFHSQETFLELESRNSLGKIFIRPMKVLQRKS